VTDFQIELWNFKVTLLYVESSICLRICTIQHFQFACLSTSICMRFINICYVKMWFVYLRVDSLRSFRQHYELWNIGRSTIRWFHRTMLCIRELIRHLTANSTLEDRERNGRLNMDVLSSHMHRPSIRRTGSRKRYESEVPTCFRRLHGSIEIISPCPDARRCVCPAYISRWFSAVISSLSTISQLNAFCTVVCSIFQLILTVLPLAILSFFSVVRGHVCWR